MKAIVGILMSVFIGLILFISMPFIDDYFSAIKFDSEKWINARSEPEGWGLRWDMRRDLVNNHKLKGKSKDDIITLLGPPTNESANNVYYYLGPAILGINCGTLEIKIQDNAVKRWRIYSG